MADVLVHNDGFGGEIGIDDNLYALVVGIAGTTSEIIARHFLGIAALVDFNATGGSAGVTEINALESNATRKGIIADITDRLWQIDGTEIGGSLESTSGDATTIGMDGIGVVLTTGRITHQDPVLGAFITYGIEHTVDGLVLGFSHIDAVDVARRKLVNLLNLLGIKGCAHHKSQQ